MKKIIYLFSLTLLFTGCCKDICQCGFMKDKSSKTKSSTFSEVNFIQTKWQVLESELNRYLLCKFKKTKNEKILVVSQQTKQSSMKRPFVFGNQIKISFIFEDKTNYIVTFSGSENSQNINGTYNTSFNELKIDDTLNELLKSKKIVSIEIMNPFGQGNETKVKQWDVSTGEKIMKLYNCFLTK